jgi:calcineurin-like phosphoesterase
VTDVGMTGSNDSVLGVTKEIVLKRFLQMRPLRFEIANKDLRSDILVLDVDPATGKTENLEHIQLRVEE